MCPQRGAEIGPLSVRRARSDGRAVVMMVRRRMTSSCAARVRLPRVRLPELAHTGRSGCLHAFVEAIITGCEPETSGRDNLKTLEAMDALVAAVAPVAPGTPVELGAC